MPNILELAVESAEGVAQWAAVNTPSKSNPEPEPSAIQNPVKDIETPTNERKRPSSSDGHQLRKLIRRSAAPPAPPAPLTPPTPTPRARRTDIATTSAKNPAWRLFLDQVLIISQKDTKTPPPPMAALDKGKGKAKEPLEDPETPKDAETPKKDPKAPKKLETPKKVVIKGKAPKKETPKKKLMKATDYKPLLGFRDDNPHHYTVLRSDVVSYMRMHGIRGIANPTADAWELLTEWATEHHSIVTYRSRHAEDKEQVDHAMQSLLRDCLHQVQQTDTKIRTELENTGMIEKDDKVVEEFKEIAVRVTLCDPDAWWRYTDKETRYPWEVVPEFNWGLIKSWTAIIGASTLSECLRIATRRLPAGRTPRRMLGALVDAVPGEVSTTYPTFTILADDEDVAGWVAHIRGLTAPRMLVVLHRAPYDGPGPNGEPAEEYDGSDTPPASGDPDYFTAEALAKALAATKGEVPVEDKKKAKGKGKAKDKKKAKDKGKAKDAEEAEEEEDTEAAGPA